MYKRWRVVYVGQLATRWGSQAPDIQGRISHACLCGNQQSRKIIYVSHVHTYLLASLTHLNPTSD